MTTVRKTLAALGAMLTLLAVFALALFLALRIVLTPGRSSATPSPISSP